MTEQAAVLNPTVKESKEKKVKRSRKRSSEKTALKTMPAPRAKTKNRMWRWIGIGAVVGAGAVIGAYKIWKGDIDVTPKGPNGGF